MRKIIENKYYTYLGDEYDFMCQNGITPIGLEFNNNDTYPILFVYAVNQQLLNAIEEYDTELEKCDQRI